MTRNTETPASQHTNERDAGFTLPEMLIAMMISGILVVAIAVAFTTVLRTQASATDRLAESKDITFVQTWLPVDLSSAIASFDDADPAALAASIATVQDANGVPMSINTVLPGTNVLTVVRPDLEVGSGTYYIVAYRYEQVNGRWQISRYEIRNPGTPSETVKTVGVAREIPAPPAGWQPNQKPLHAVNVQSRTQYIRPVGEDVKVEFESGNEFVSGGGGLSAENELPQNYEGGLTNPSAPPSRCGKRIALILDTSGSVPAGNGGVPLETAAVSFIDGFTGTPTTFSINGFDREAYGMLTTPGNYVTNGERAPFISVLNSGPQVDAMRKRVTDLDNRDGSWNQNNADSPTVDGIHWDQIGVGTNWEDAWFMTYKRSDGTPYGVDNPELVVFITDGQPTLQRTAAGGSAGAGASDAANLARTQAEDARRAGARTIGVMVGNVSNNATYVEYLTRVVGTKVWDGSVASNGTVVVGNAATADLFKGSFAQLGPILRSILIAECGGTLTVQKRIDTGSGLVQPDSGAWQYTTDIGDRELDIAASSSITFDYVFSNGEATKEVFIIEAPVAGYVFDRAECTAGGEPIASTNLTTDPRDGDVLVAGVRVTLAVDEAVSCKMISRPA